MRVRFIETPKSTDWMWNNQLFRESDHKDGDAWSDIMNMANVGDTVINGVGQEFLVIRVIVNEKDGDWTTKQNRGLNWLCVLHPTKKDGTVHRGLASESFENVGFGWEKR